MRSLCLPNFDSVSLFALVIASEFFSQVNTLDREADKVTTLRRTCAGTIIQFEDGDGNY